MAQELHDFLNVRTESSIIVDRSVDGDLLRINFNFRCVSLYIANLWQTRCAAAAVFAQPCCVAFILPHVFLRLLSLHVSSQTSVMT